MLVTVMMAIVSAKSDIEPEAVYLGTVIIDLMTLEIVGKLLGVF